MKRFLLMALIGGLPVLLSAQTPLSHEKGAYVDSLKQYYQQASLPLYLLVSHKPDQGYVMLQEEGGTEKKITPGEGIQLDGHGKHYFRHIDQIHHKAQNFVVFADGMAPVSQLKFRGAAKHLYKNQVFYGKQLKATLSTSDEMSGVAQLLQSVNATGFAPYTEDIAFNQEGLQTFTYYAVDRVGNVENKQSSSFVVDLSAPKTYYNIVGIAKDKIISLSTQIYLTTEDSLSGVKNTFYSFDQGTPVLYEGGQLPLNALADGSHELFFYSSDHVDNIESPQKTAFYLDKTAPIMSADVLGDKFVVGNEVYFSGRTKLKLTAVDNKSGIKNVFYSINGEEFAKYEEPFYLPDRSGMHTVRYYAIDNVANEGSGSKTTKTQEFLHNVNKVYVDLTGPTLSFDYQGRTFLKGDTVFINSNTQVMLSATDPESGLKNIAYSLDGAQTEFLYNQAFNIPTAGFHSLDYFGYDNVNNRNTAKTFFIVDNEGPTISHVFSVSPIKTSEKKDTYPAYTQLYLAATDHLTGCDKIYYTINKEAEKVYTGIIGGLEKGKNYTIKLRAEDKLGNQTETEIEFKTGKY